MFFTDLSSHLNGLITKAFEIKLKPFKRDVDNCIFKYFPNLKTVADFEIYEKTFKVFKYNFLASLIQLVINFLLDLLNSDNLKKLQDS